MPSNTSNIVQTGPQFGGNNRPPKLKKPRPPPPKPQDHSSGIIIGEATGNNSGDIATGIMGDGSGM
jgi:hypothetical protein